MATTSPIPSLLLLLSAATACRTAAPAPIRGEEAGEILAVTAGSVIRGRGSDRPASVGDLVAPHQELRVPPGGSFLVRTGGGHVRISSADGGSWNPVSSTEAFVSDGARVEVTAVGTYKIQSIDRAWALVRPGSGCAFLVRTRDALGRWIPFEVEVLSGALLYGIGPFGMAMPLPAPVEVRAGQTARWTGTEWTPDSFPTFQLRVIGKPPIG